MLKDNPAYHVVFESQVHADIKLYAPVEVTKYHNHRHIAARAQDIYSSSGADKALQAQYRAEIKRLCVEGIQRNTKDNFMAINTLMDNLDYRSAYPIDELCAIRMGALYCFLEDENPDTVQNFYTQKKLDYALGKAVELAADPAMYDFFLNMGVAFTPSWQESLHHLDDMDYFNNRNESLRGLLSQSQSK